MLAIRGQRSEVLDSLPREPPGRGERTGTGGVRQGRSCQHTKDPPVWQCEGKIRARDQMCAIHPRIVFQEECLLTLFICIPGSTTYIFFMWKKNFFPVAENFVGKFTLCKAGLLLLYMLSESIILCPIVQWFGVCRCVVL